MSKEFEGTKENIYFHNFEAKLHENEIKRTKTSIPHPPKKTQSKTKTKQNKTHRNEHTCTHTEK